MKKVAIYVRVSTRDKGQDVENQVGQLKKFCHDGSFEIVEIYSDNESGQKGRRERKAFDQMFKDARLRKFNILLFWALDRFTREGTLKTLHYLELLDSYGIKLISFTEDFFNTDNDIYRGIIIPIMAYFAKLEAKKISERTKAGLERAKSKGIKLGAKSMSDLGIDKKIVYLQSSGRSDTEIMNELKISRNTVKKYKVKDED
jgi:DNA invertase Pin-like site-specific DNA recombinase